MSATSNESNAWKHDLEAERYLQAMLSDKLAQNIAAPCELCEASVIRNEYNRFKISHISGCPNE